MKSFNIFDYNYSCLNNFSRITFHDWFSSQIHNLVFSVYSRGEWSEIFFIISSFSSTLDDSEACDGDGDTGDDGDDDGDDEEEGSPTHLKPSLPHTKLPFLISCLTAGLVVMTFQRDISPLTDSSLSLNFTPFCREQGKISVS